MQATASPGESANKWELLPSLRLGVARRTLPNGTRVYTGIDGRPLCEHGEYPGTIQSWIAKANAYENWQAAGGVQSGIKQTAPRRPPLCNCKSTAGLGRRKCAKACGPDTPQIPESIYDVLHDSQAPTFQSHYDGKLQLTLENGRAIPGENQDDLPHMPSSKTALRDEALLTPLRTIRPDFKRPRPPCRNVYLGKSGRLYCHHGNVFMMATPSYEKMGNRKNNRSTGRCACILTLPRRRDLTEVPLGTTVGRRLW